jgi:hypothetical protein
MKGRSVLIGIIGVGLGWLVGLSQSPVIAGVVTALVAAAAALVGALGGPDIAGSDDTSRLQKVAKLISPAPLAALMIGLAVGAPLGLHARNHGFFSPSRADHMKELEDTVARWTAMGMARDVIVARLFEREFPARTDGNTDAGVSESGAVPSGLVASGAAEECAGFRRAGKDQILLELRSSTRPAVRSLANALADTPDSARVGELMLEAVCPPGS